MVGLSQIRPAGLPKAVAQNLSRMLRGVVQAHGPHTAYRAGFVNPAAHGGLEPEKKPPRANPSPSAAAHHEPLESDVPGGRAPAVQAPPISLGETELDISLSSLLGHLHAKFGIQPASGLAHGT